MRNGIPTCRCGCIYLSSFIPSPDSFWYACQACGFKFPDESRLEPNRADPQVNVSVNETRCYNCQTLISRETTYGGHRVGAKPAPKACEYVLCRSCLRMVCEGPIRKQKQIDLDVQYIEGKRDDRDLPFCDCQTCQKEDAADGT